MTILYSLLVSKILHSRYYFAIVRSVLFVPLTLENNFFTNKQFLGRPVLKSVEGGRYVSYPGSLRSTYTTHILFDTINYLQTLEIASISIIY